VTIRGRLSRSLSFRIGFERAQFPQEDAFGSHVRRARLMVKAAITVPLVYAVVRDEANC
jgi:hypothetical protein